MKRYIAFSAIITALALTGCASGADSSTALATEIAPAVEQPDIAFVTREAPDDSAPPQLGVEYSGNGLASMSVLTLGSGEWNADGTTSVICSADPLESESSGAITAKIDLDCVDGSPKILLYGGTLKEAELFPLDGSDSIALDFSGDGTVEFPADSPDGVVSVKVDFDRGSCEYFFTVTRSQRTENEPPKLRIFIGDYGYSMTRGGYTWTVTDGDEAHTIAVDCASPWQMYQNDQTADIYCEPGAKLTVKLPENSAITSAVYYTAEDVMTELEYSGGEITAPAVEMEAPCRITVEMPQGSCDYVFKLSTRVEMSVPAYSPE